MEGDHNDSSIEPKGGVKQGIQHTSNQRNRSFNWDKKQNEESKQRLKKKDRFPERACARESKSLWSDRKSMDRMEGEE